MEVVIGAVALFIEERFAIPGDIMWAGVAIAGTVCIGALYSPEILRWATRKVTSPPEQETQGKVHEDALPLPYPVSYTWLESKEAYMLIRTSTLVIPLPDWSKDIQKPEWEEIQDYEETQANEMAAMYLGDFKLECPDAVRDGEYGLQTLRWWIGKKIQEQDASDE